MAGKKRVPDYDYLYQIGGSLVVRVQVPKPLQDLLGRSELKKSFGADHAAARNEYYRTVADFKDQIAGARASSGTSVRTDNRDAEEPSPEEMEAGCYAHYQLMMKHLRGKNVAPDGRKAWTRQERAQGFREMLEIFADNNDAGEWQMMSFDVDGLCERNRWKIEKSSATYERLCRLMLRARVQAYRNELRILDGFHSADPDGDTLFGAVQPAKITAPQTLGDLMERFKAARSLRWSPSTSKNYIIIFRVIEEICGNETRLELIDHAFCVQVRDKLLTVPANYKKVPSLSDKPLTEVIAISQAMGMRRISAATVNSHLNKLGAIIRYGRDQAWINGNPMAGIDVPDPISPEDKRDPFTIDQLSQIFATRPWIGNENGLSDRPSRYWAPLISLFSGARLTEVCGQRVDEMIVEEGVHAFHFRHRPGDRAMKNGKSRKVPVHPELIRLGLWEFVASARASNRDMLFNDVSRHKLGKWGDGTSKWFARKVRALGLEGTNLSFHSLRHTFEDALRRVDLHDTPLGNAITGRWSAGTSKNYGNKYPLSRLHEAIRQVSYPGLLMPVT